MWCSAAGFSIMRKCFRVRKGFSKKNNLIVLAICGISIYFMCLITLEFTGGRITFKSPIYTNGSSVNYFQHASRVLQMQHLVDTKSCKIPDFDAFDEDAVPFITLPLPMMKCNEARYNWSRVVQNKLIIDRNQVERDGYTMYKGFCCYKIVERVTLTMEEQKYQSNIKNADNLIKYSSCIDINSEVTELQHEFIMVECGWIKFIPVAVTYRAFHGTALVEGSQKAKNIERKINYWKSQTEEDRLPPNVLILGLDSTSRLNVRRHMFKTVKLLEELQAVEIMGYTKAGENTFPNYVPLFSGYSEDDLMKICYASRATPQDDCPYIWKRFDSANYITSLSEDTPVSGGFNFLKTGFITQPVDYYLRTLIQSAHDYGHPPLYVVRRDSLDCIGHQTNAEAILSYVESVMDRGHTNKTPVYIVSWSTNGPHDDNNYLQLIDNTYATFLRRMLDKGYLENTILIFMGDHGYRYGPFRETMLGYYEDKLPNLWIRLPPWIKEELPEWQTALEINSRRLTSPFTTYWTLNQILEMFSSVSAPKAEQNLTTGELINRKHIQNFFEPVPEDNSCADVGVPEEFCACYLPDEILLNSPLLNEAAVKALNSKNLELLPNCAPLKVHNLIAGTVVVKSADIKRVVVGFTSEPGNYVFEAEIDYFTKNKTFSDKTFVRRTSRINPSYTQCIKDAVMELFCYCMN